jgi:hypothetical protein
MIIAMINPTITASKTMIITKSCVWLGEVDVVFFTESAALGKAVATGEGDIGGVGVATGVLAPIVMV